MLIRNSPLPRNHRAGCFDDRPLRTVHHRPPKKIAPSKKPTTPAKASISVSFIGILLFLPHGLVFLDDPVPRIQTADRETGHQQRQRPGMLARVVLVQPETERRAEERRN